MFFIYLARTLATMHGIILQPRNIRAKWSTRMHDKALFLFLQVQPVLALMDCSLSFECCRKNLQGIS